MYQFRDKFAHLKCLSCIHAEKRMEFAVMWRQIRDVKDKLNLLFFYKGQ